MIWHILKYLLSFSIPAFYRRIQIKNAHQLKTDEPAIIVSNHPNAFMDPILFSYMVYPPRVRYMARGDAFKPGLISAILQSIGIVPIFRMQDAGIEGLKKNNESYKVVYRLLKKNKKVMIFAEGICIQEKRLRPIKKGVPRLIYTAQQHLDPKKIAIIPVCLNYSNAAQIGSDVFVNVGEKFYVEDMNEFMENPNAVMLKRMTDIYEKMLPLIVHIDKPENDELFEKTRCILTDYLCQKRNLNAGDLNDVFLIEKEIANTINRAEPKQLSSFAEKVNEVFQHIEKNDISIPVIINYTKQNHLFFYSKMILFTLIYPFYYMLYVIAAGFMYLPYIASHSLAQKFSKKGKEFYASFFLAFSTFIFLFYYLMVYFSLRHFIHPFKLILFFIYTLAFIPLIHYFPLFKKQLATMLKILKNKTFALNLSKIIQQISTEYEQIKNHSAKN